MILLVDVGNTALKLAIYDNAKISLVSIESLNWQQITAVVYASVATASDLAQLLLMAKHNKVACYQAKVTKSSGNILCGYENFETLGVDRWLVVLASADRFIKTQQATNVVIIDAGTATTVDIVDQNNQHLGGWIIPGLDLMVDSVTSRTEQVFVDQTTPFKAQLGVSTPAGLKNGCLAATIGSILFSRTLVDESALFIFTGGYGEFLQQHIADLIPNNTIFDATLIFQGLLVWFKNQQDCS